MRRIIMTGLAAAILVILGGTAMVREAGASDCTTYLSKVKEQCQNMICPSYFKTDAEIKACVIGCAQMWAATYNAMNVSNNRSRCTLQP